MTSAVRSPDAAVLPAFSAESAASAGQRTRVLTLSSIAFTLMFAVWLMFGVLGLPIRKELGLTDVQFSWLTAIAILNGSLWRLSFGILTDRYGGRRVFTILILLTAIPTFMVGFAHSYAVLLLGAFLIGMAGNAFSIGIAWNSAWYPRGRQGVALGVFGAGNVGASVTKFIGPAIIAATPAAGYFGGIIPGGWRFVPFLYGILLVMMAIAMWKLAPRHDRCPGRGRSLSSMLKPLQYVRVWRFSLYYTVVFGAYVALSVWLPRLYQDVFGLSLSAAALLTALFIFPASLLRPLGGWMSDRFGPRRVMYSVLGLMLLASLLLSLPHGSVAIPLGGGRTWLITYASNVWLFTGLVFVLGVGMGLGKAAVYKYIPEYFPHDVGAVGGLVGLLGALGGFFLPPLFASLEKAFALPQMTFLVLFILTGLSLLWLHVTVVRMARAAELETRHALL